MRIGLPQRPVRAGLSIVLVLVGIGSACGVGGDPSGPLSLAASQRGEPVDGESTPSLNTPGAQAPPAPDFALPWPLDPAPEPRTTDASGTIVISGDDCYDRSANSSLDTPGQLQLNAETRETSWGIYAFGGIDPADGPFGVNIELAGDQPLGYYLGVANYAREAWEWIELAAPTGGDYSSVPVAWQPVSGEGIVYAAVLVWNDQAAAVANVALHLNVDIPPPLDLTASDGESGSTIILSWTDPEVSFPGLEYEAMLIERAFALDGPFAPLELVPAGTTGLEDVHDGAGNSLPYNAPVYYRASTIVAGTPGPPGPLAEGFRLLADVTGFSATDDNPWEVSLTWDAVPGAEVYRLDYRAQGGGEPADWEVLVQTPFLSYGHNDLDEHCEENQIYEYRIKAWYLEDASLGYATAEGMRRGMPIADIQLWPEVVIPGEIVEVDATASYDPGGGEITLYRLDYDSDGSYDDESLGGTFNCYYGRCGDYLATVEVTDDEGDTATASAPVQVPGWQHTWGSGDIERGHSVAADSSGNVYVGGDYLGFTAEDYIALSKYDSDGQRQWSHYWAFGGSTRNHLAAVMADSAGNAYLAGDVETASEHDAFTAKVLPDGTLDWTATWGTSGTEIIRGAALDDAGHLLLCGYTNGFAGSNETLILLYDLDGNLTWSKTWGVSGDSYESGACVMISPGGWSELYFGIDLMTPTGDGMGLLVLDDQADIFLQRGWWHAAEYMGVQDLTVGNGGQVYVCGYLCGTGEFPDAILLKVDDDEGDFLWQKRWNSSTGDPIGDGWNTVCFDGLRVQLFGDCAGPDGTYVDALWVTLDDTGAPLRQLTMGTNVISESINGVYRDSAGALYLAGSALNSATSWHEVSGLFSDMSGTVTTLSGTVSDVSGTSASPAYSELDIDPVVDDGGGGMVDIYVSKLGPIS